MEQKIKVCHLTSAHPRYDQRIYAKECCSLAQNEYEVYLVVNDDLDDEYNCGVNIISTGFVPQNRLARMFLGTKKVYRKALKMDADIYHLHDPELQMIAKKLKKKKKKVIFDAHEDTEEQIKDKDWIPKPLLKLVTNFYVFYSRNVLSILDAIVTVSPNLVEKFKKINNCTVMVTNYPIISDMDNKTFDEKDFLNESYICFAGGIDVQWMHHVILRALNHVPNIMYVLAGSDSGNYLSQLQNMSEWKYVNYLGVVSHDKVRGIYRHAIAGMAVNDCSQLKGIGTLGNTKLFECMEAGVPLICTDYPLWKEIVEENHCGICVNPQNVKDIAEAICYLREHPNEARKMGQNGRRAVLEKYNWKREEEKLIDLYKNVWRKK